MAKKELAIRLLVNESDVNLAVSRLTNEVPENAEELRKRFFDREPVVVDVTEIGEDSLPLVTAFTAFILAAENEVEELKTNKNN